MLEALTKFLRITHLDLWQFSETEWRLSLRRPEPAPRRNRGKVVALARHLPLPDVSASGSPSRSSMGTTARVPDDECIEVKRLV